MKGREYAWAERVGWALATAGQGLRCSADRSQDENNYHEKDCLAVTSAQSWTGDHGDFSSFIEQCTELRKAVQNLAQPFTTPPDFDLSSILEEGRKLLAAIRQQLAMESSLLLEDIGRDTQRRN